MPAPVFGDDLMLCPVCKSRELPPGRTVCSPACRTRRWREQRAAGLADLRGQLVGLREQIDRALSLLPSRADVHPTARRGYASKTP